MQPCGTDESINNSEADLISDWMWLFDFHETLLESERVKCNYFTNLSLLLFYYN